MTTNCYSFKMKSRQLGLGPSVRNSCLQTTMLPVLLLQSTFLQSQTRQLQRQLFFCNLKQLVRQEANVGIQIAPLTRNQGPNASILNVKSGSSSEVFGTLIRNFEVVSKDCHACGSALYKEYRQRVNDVEKFMKTLEAEKRKIQQKERQITQKVKTLRFQTVPVSEQPTQTQTNLDRLMKREVDQVRVQQQLRIQQYQSSKLLQNKQNYLTYLQQIMKERRVDLDRKQSQLQDLQHQVSGQEAKLKTQPLTYLMDSKSLYQYFALLKDKIYNAVMRYESGEPQLIKLLENHPLYDLFDEYDRHNKDDKLKLQILRVLQVNIVELRYKLEVAEEYFYSECEKVEELKGALQEKNVKFMELNSYEHFLDRYRSLLDQREESLSSRTQLFQEEMKVVMEYLDIKACPQSQQSQASFSFLQHIDKESRASSGKGRIFTLRQHANNIMDQYKSLKPDLQKQFLSQKVNKMREEYQAQFAQIKRVKQLEEENVVLKRQIAQKKERPTEQTNYDQKVGDDLDNILQEAQKKKRVVNCLSKWLRLSFHNNIKNNNLNKGFAFLVWRSHQYDPECYDRVKQLIQETYEPHQDDLWGRKCDVLKKQKLFPYKSLSLKRKQFLQQFFDYERKHFFKERLKSLLLSITRNKVRKEKIVFVAYFHRFARNALLNRLSGSKLTNQKETLRSASRSLKPIVNTNSRTTLSFDSSHTKRSTKGKQDSNRETTQRHYQKQRVQNQKRYRKMLGCSKLTHFLRDLGQKNTDQTFWAFNQVKSCNQQRKICKLQAVVEQIEFNNSMFVTKFNITQSSFLSKMALVQELLALAPK